ncbi:DUF424 family protein [Candidatus Woesearchaeota archaeon]|nr:DUF424 family protein [Candidatus Woesearchaeota archaeon]
MDFIVAEKQGPHGRVVVVSDENILGRIFEQDNLRLDLTSKFYRGFKKTGKEVIALLKGAQHLHFTGKHSVALAIELNLIESKNILYVNGVPHAEMVFGE